MAAARRKPTRITGDHGPAERYQHGDLVALEPSDIAGISHARVTTQTMLDRYLARGLLGVDAIGRRRHNAGSKLYADWRAGGCEPAIVAGYDRAGGVDSDRGAIAYTRCMRAIRAVGLELSPMLVHVCCTDLSAGDWAVGKRMDRKAGLPILCLALDALARHYGLT